MWIRSSSHASTIAPTMPVMRAPPASRAAGARCALDRSATSVGTSPTQSDRESSWIGTSTPSVSRYCRSARAATARSCVMVTSAAPVWDAISSSRSMTSPPVSTSSAPVGSSARITRGPRTSARAMATRCCSPPESLSGMVSTRSPRPTRSSICVASLVRCQNCLPAGVEQGSGDVLERRAARQEVELLEHEPEVPPAPPGARAVRQASDRHALEQVLARWSARRAGRGC